MAPDETLKHSMNANGRNQNVTLTNLGAVKSDS